MTEKVEPRTELPHDTAKMLVSWCLQESYKMSVHNIGISDWSKATEEEKEAVLDGQYIIAEMLRSTVVEMMK